MTEGTDTRICVVCDFPFGLSTTSSKVLQAREYCKRGDIYELDIVANYGWIRSGLIKEVRNELRSVCEACHEFGTAVKVIFETDALDLEQIYRAIDASVEAGADFVKTSTGFYTGGNSDGATPELIEKMITYVNGRCQVKGSGGIRTREHFLQLINMGIDRMGIGYRSTPEVLACSPEDAALMV